MSLVKLWKAIFGTSQPTDSSKPNPASVNQDRHSDRPKRKLAKPTKPKRSALKSQQPAQPSAVKPDRVAKVAKRQPAAKRGVLDFVSGGPHASLCRMIKKSGATRILEVGVGDGTRAMAVLSTLAKSKPGAELKYIAIDLFEMGDGQLTLKEFHQQLRTINVKPHLIPMPYEQGLVRVVHTFGTVDLLLLADQDLDSCDPLIARVTDSSSLVLHFDGQNWKQIETKNPDQGGDRTAA